MATYMSDYKFDKDIDATDGRYDKVHVINHSATGLYLKFETKVYRVHYLPPKI